MAFQECEEPKIKTTKPLKKYCLCHSLTASMRFCRFFGIFPLTWHHLQDKKHCHFRISIKWIIYSVLLAIICIIEAYISIDELFLELSQNSGKGRNVFIMLTYLKDVSFLSLSAFLILIGCVNARYFKRCLNNLSPILNSGLLCDSAACILNRLQWVFITFTCFYMLINVVTLTYLNITDGYETNWNAGVFFVHTLNIIPNTFYIISCSFGTLFISFFGCFEHMLLNTLKFESILELGDESHLRCTLFSLVKYRVCKERHNLCDIIGKKVAQTEIIEQLRFLHEKICVEIRAVNDALNPQMLVLMGTELALLVFSWYSVIVYTKYNNKDIRTDTINFFNWVFIIVHSWAIIVFIRSGQQVMTLFNGLSDFLFEYSTRYLSITEHQQIRIFINKLRFNPVTINASGVFTVGLNLAAPICGNIFTYVLVALQFRAQDYK